MSRCGHCSVRRGPRKAEAPGTSRLESGRYQRSRRARREVLAEAALSGLESESQEDHLVTALCHPLIRNGPLGLQNSELDSPHLASYTASSGGNLNFP